MRNLLGIMACITVLTGCNAESAPSRWQSSHTGNNGLFTALLDCKSSPDTGEFQECEVAFLSNDGQPVQPSTLSIDGGMPLHGHGLPTQPELVNIAAGKYRIDGLKYNMPGAWLLGFKLTTEQGEDKIIFDFVI